MEKYVLGLGVAELLVTRYTYGNIQKNIIIDCCASAGGGLRGCQRALGMGPCAPPAPLPDSSTTLGTKGDSGKEIPQGTAPTGFGWLEMSWKSFLIIQSFRKGGYNAELSSPLVHSEAPSLISFLSLFTLVSAQAAVKQGRHHHNHSQCWGCGCFLIAHESKSGLSWFCRKTVSFPRRCCCEKTQE